MEYDEWLALKTKEASTIIVIALAALLLVFAILRHWLPTITLYLFLWDYFHQVLFYLGGVVALAEMLWMKYQDTPLQKRFFTGIALLCLFVASYQAWVDEHRNAEDMREGKQQAVQDREFWKGQSYAKDEALRVRDGLLQQNFTTLSGSQQALANLSTKILDISKPAPQKTTILARRFGANDIKQRGKFVTFITMLTTKPATPASFLVNCNGKVNNFALMPIDGAGPHISTSNMVDDHSGILTMNSPSWSPSQPIFIVVGHDDPSLTLCKVTQQRL